MFCARLGGGQSRQNNLPESTIVANCGCDVEASNRGEHRTLVTVLAINALMFVLEFGFGVV
ncbi:MAG TPA: hypothetical protein P5569_10885, partial [Candidatus Latescibacteria bacterium]|nr:hypothetical protein [Candidatus Latescibacterota bacterium]